MQPISTHVPLSRLSATHAKTWLMNNDAEAKEFWAGVQGKKNLIDAVKDNLRQFGINKQSGSIVITTNNSMYFDEEIRMRYS